MADEIQRSVQYGCRRKDRPHQMPNKVIANITVYPNESCFTVIPTGKAPEQFGLELFHEFEEVKNGTATQMELLFVDSDSRKSLCLKFNRPEDLRAIYNALFPMFEKADKLRKKKKILPFAGIGGFVDSPGAKPRVPSSQMRSSQDSFRPVSSYGPVNNNASRGRNLKNSGEACANRHSLRRGIGYDVSQSPSKIECRDGPGSQKPKNGDGDTVVLPVTSNSMCVDIPTKTQSTARPSYSSMAGKSLKNSAAVCQSKEVFKKEVPYVWRDRPQARNRRNRQVSLNLKDQILKSPWRFRSFVNLGNSCYMNAVLQILFYLSGVRNRLSRLEAWKHFKKNCTNIMTSLFALEEKMSIMKYKKIPDDELRDFLRKELSNIREDSGKELDREFSSYRQQDAHEYWSKLFDRIEHGILDYEKVKRSTTTFNKLLHPGDLFKIEITTSLGCNHCTETKAPRTEDFLDMKLDISEDSFSEESVAFLIKKSLCIEELEFKCEKCGETEANKTQAISVFPQYLVLVILRYDYNGYGRKKNNHILVDRDLSLADLHVHSQMKKAERKEFLERRPTQVEHSPSEISPCLASGISMDSEKKTVFSYSDVLSGKRSNIDSERSQLQPMNVNDSIVPSVPEEAVDSDCMEVDTPSAVNNTNESDFMEASPMRNGLYGGGPGSVGNNEEGHNDSLIVCETVMTETLLLFKPLRRSTLVRIRNQLDISKIVALDDVCSYDSMFLPESELFPAELPEVHIVVGDGNCLFRSFSWWLFNGDDRHFDVLRKKITTFLRQFTTEFSHFLPENIDMDEHIRNMRDDGEWGSHVELYAASTIFGCPVFTYHNSAWKRFSPRFSVVFDEQTGKFEKSFSKAEENDVYTTGAIYLSNEEGYHYNPVIGRKIRSENHSLDHPEPVYVYKDSDGPMYTLTGAINHIGTSMTSGHYKAITYDESAGVWVNCDDAIISVISEKEVLDEAGRNGYMLIYKKRTVGDEMEFTHAKDYLKN